MGAWGTGVFSDDTACDVRNDYLDLIGDGLSGTEATKKLLREWSDTLADPDEAPVFWLALAATQWKKGRLEDQVLQHALTIINNGSDLARWDLNSKDYRKRQLVLEKLRAQITSPPPPAKKIPKRFRDSNEWGVGDLISYRLLSGRSIILRVVGHHTDKGGTSPACEILDWVGDVVPEELSTFGIRQGGEIWRSRPLTQLIIGRARAKERPDDRLRHLGVSLRPSQKAHPCIFTLWRSLDSVLKKDFGVE